MGAIDGLISGLNTTQIISQLMQVERLPEQQLTDHKTASQTMVSTMQGLNSLFTTLQTAANAFVPDSITKQSAWGSTTGTSSAPTLAARDHRSDGPAGQRPLHRHQRGQRRVRRLVRAPSARSPAPVATGPFPVTKGTAALGLSSVTPGSTLSAGAHTITVTQASGAATLTGAHVLAARGGPRFAEHARLHPHDDGGSIPDLRHVGAGRPTRPTQLAAEIGRASGGALTARASTTAATCRSAPRARGRPSP